MTNGQLQNSNQRLANHFSIIDLCNKIQDYSHTRLVTTRGIIDALEDVYNKTLEKARNHETTNNLII